MSENSDCGLVPTTVVVVVVVVVVCLFVCLFVFPASRRVLLHL